MSKRLTCPLVLRRVTVVLTVAASLLVLQPTSSLAASDTTIIAWGRNTWGESDIPPGMSDVRQISGAAHSLVLHTDGTVTAWGLNEAGETDVPATLSDVAEVAAGGFHSMALRNDDTLVVWGDNTYGQSTVPAALGDVVAISGGRYHSMALRADGTVASWGSNSSGQATVPPGLRDVVAIDAGGFHSLALRSDGTVAAWGDNTYGQSTVPAGLDDVVAVAAGWNHSLALQADGRVVAWGNNDHGQTTVPAGLPPVAAVSAGAMHSLVALTDGTIATWGDTAHNLMQVPPGITGVTQITGKAMNSMVLADDPAPTAVTNLAAPIVTNAKVTLTWNYPAVASDRDVTRLLVRRAAGEVPPATVSDGVAIPSSRALFTSITDPVALAVGERYSYSVFAQDAAGNVGVPATITVPTLLTPVRDAEAAPDSSTSLSLTWTNPDNDQLKRIIVRRSTGATAPPTASSATSVTLTTAVTQSVINTGLSPSTTYSYSIFAQDRVGNISPLGSGSIVTANTSGTVPPPGGGNGPAPVSNLTAPIVTNTKVNLAWQYPSGVARVIVRGIPGVVSPATITQGVEVMTGRPLTTSATDTSGLEVGQRYSYSVFTQDAAGNVGAPATITVPVSFPTPVTNAAATVDSPTSLTLAWTNPDNDQLKKIIVRRAVGTTAPATPTSGTSVSLPTVLSQSVSVNGLQPGTSYSFSIFAQDRIGNVSTLGAGSIVSARTG